MILVSFIVVLVAVSIHADCPGVGRNRLDIVIHSGDESLCCNSGDSYVPSKKCRPGWTYNDGSCYAVGNVSKNWGVAAAVCKSHGAYLIEIETAEENAWLVNLLRTGNIGSVWIGASELLHRGVITWANSGRALTFTDWSPGQPADFLGVWEDCVEIGEPFNFKWDFHDCMKANKYICETRPLPK